MYAVYKQPVTTRWLHEINISNTGYQPGMVQWFGVGFRQFLSGFGLPSSEGQSFGQLISMLLGEFKWHSEQFHTNPSSTWYVSFWWLEDKIGGRINGEKTWKDWKMAILRPCFLYQFLSILSKTYQFKRLLVFLWQSWLHRECRATRWGWIIAVVTWIGSASNLLNNWQNNPCSTSFCFYGNSFFTTPFAYKQAKVTTICLPTIEVRVQSALVTVVITWAIDERVILFGAHRFLKING